MAILGIFKRAKPAARPKVRPKPARRPKVIKRPPVKPPKPVKRAPVKKPPVRLPAKPPPVKMPDARAYELLRGAGIPVAPYAFVRRERDLPAVLRKIKFPVVLKVSGPTIVHKTEVGGIIKDINSEAAAAEAFKRLMAIKGAEAVLVQKQLSGTELIVGAKADPQFGYIVSVGIGGIYVEVLRDIAFRIAPIAHTDAAAMVRELKGYEILAGVRGMPAIKFEALYDVLVRVSRLIGTAKLKELDINPLFCTSEGCWAADVRAVK